MIKKMTSGCIKLVERFLPDPYIFAILLSAIVLILGIVVNKQTPYEMILHWGSGFWGFLAFSMQMALVVILGNCLATAPIFTKLVNSLARVPKSPRQAVAFTTLVAGIACMIQWGFGLVIGAILAKKVAQVVRGVDFRLLIAAAYSTFLLTVLTSSITLKAASNPDELIKVTNGALTEVIPLARTAYHPVTIGALLILLITLPLLNARMHPAAEETICIDPSLLMDEDEAPAEKPKKDMTPAERLENSRIIPVLIFLCGAIYVFTHFAINKKSLDIDVMNFMLLMFGVLLHRTPIAYIRAVGNAIKSASGIILQFPFYAGIMGMMTGMNPATGYTLAGMISEGFVSIANHYTFPFLSFLSAALVNLFVPSAGGQWGVQAPILFTAGKALNVDPALTTITLCWGDTWTNMIQPFWALPCLGIAGLGVRDIMGFCVMVLLWSGVVISGSILVWTFFF